MSATALDTCRRLLQAHARLQRKLDDELGTLHGLSLADFQLLDALAAQGPMTAAQLGAPLGVQRSSVVRQVIALEKTGLVERTVAADGARLVGLRASGRRLLHEAAETVGVIGEAALAHAADPVEALCESRALALR